MRRQTHSRSQRIINQRRPSRAHQIPDEPHTRWIRVDARIHWERDGIEWVPALAKRWTAHHVWVQFPDVRLHGGGVWLDPSDVRRA